MREGIQSKKSACCGDTLRIREHLYWISKFTAAKHWLIFPSLAIIYPKASLSTKTTEAWIKQSKLNSTCCSRENGKKMFIELLNMVSHLMSKENFFSFQLGITHQTTETHNSILTWFTEHSNHKGSTEVNKDSASFLKPACPGCSPSTLLHGICSLNIQRCLGNILYSWETRWTCICSFNAYARFLMEQR